MVNTVPPLSVATVCRMSARARRSSSCRARRAPWAAVTPSARAVHRAYQDLGVLTGSSSGSLTGAAGPILGKAGAERPRGNAGMPWPRGPAAPDVVAVPVVPDEGSGTTRARWRPARACARARRAPRPPAARRAGTASSPSRVSWPSVAVSTARAMLARAAGWPASTSTTALPVCSRVRPTRDCRPNSSTASNSRRRRTRVRTRAGTSRARGRRQNGANSSRSTRSGGMIR